MLPNAFLAVCGILRSLVSNVIRCWFCFSTATELSCSSYVFLFIYLLVSLKMLNRIDIRMHKCSVCVCVCYMARKLIRTEQFAGQLLLMIQRLL